MEQIVNGTPLASISPNIVSQDALDMHGVKVIVQDHPIINFIRKCQTIIRIIGETLLDYHIGNAEQWYKLVSKGIGRCQIALHNVEIGVIDE